MTAILAGLILGLGVEWVEVAVQASMFDHASTTRSWIVRGVTVALLFLAAAVGARRGKRSSSILFAGADAGLAVSQVLIVVVLAVGGS